MLFDIVNVAGQFPQIVLGHAGQPVDDTDQFYCRIDGEGDGI